MLPTEFVKILAARDTTSEYHGFSTIVSEAGHPCLLLSVTTLKQISEFRKFFQVQQTPEFRFISIEPLTSFSVNGIQIYQTNRFQVRFKMIAFA